MLESGINILVIILICSGLILFTGGSVGILRMPDFYTRIHPSGKLDTLGTLCMILGLSVYNIDWAHITLSDTLVSIKMLLIVLFMFYASPTATHAIVDAGLHAGMRPWQKGDKRRR
ncbi:MAG: monovalent cation/H(+) antiporter subunit G [Thermodesulfobacteriota bacterium]